MIEQLDLRGLKCPLPALYTGRKLDQMQAGDELAVLASDPMSAIDIPVLVQLRGDVLLKHTRQENELRFLIKKTK